MARHVLVADDDRDGADSLAELLKLELGCHVTTVYDGAAALQQALADPPDVLILDIRMPRMGGLEVARQLAQRFGTARRRPLVLAMTGGHVSDTLDAIDGSFDRAFAKPIDIGQLVQALRDHWRGAVAPAVRFELSELFTRVAREAMPRLRAGGQQLSFDYRGPLVLVEGDPVAVHTGLYRVLLGLTDVVGAGFLIFKASVQPDAAGAWTLVVQAAGTGEPVGALRVGEVLERLGLHDTAADTAVPGRLGARKASGLCPNSGARISYMSVPTEGVLFRFELPVRPIETHDEPVDANGARAWIVGHDGVAAALLGRRLQRLGWRVRAFERCDALLEQLDQHGEDAPDLVAGMESDGLDAVSWTALSATLPPQVQRLFIVVAGSPILRGDTADGSPAAIEPLSPAELIALTRQVAGHAEDGGPSTLAAALRDRPRVLVADDVEINRIVAGGLIRALGYEVSTVGDGLDAIEHCKSAPPDVVLMDVNMPVLNGLDATRRIRELQRLGRMAPFPIVAASADDDVSNLERCREVGMDGFLSKPLNLQRLKEELRRVTLNAPG